MRELPTGTVTLLFTDIEGSTHLLQQLGERYAGVLEKSRILLRTAFQAFGGHEVDTQGDAFFVSFTRASDALSAAGAAQRSLASHAWPDGIAVRVRMGLHTGEPSLSAEGYVGLDVHRAARIMSVGHGGQILLSQTTRDLVEQQVPEGIILRDLGSHRLKDLERPQHLFQLVISNLQADFPPLKTLNASPNNLPIQLTPFIGREQELTVIGALILRKEVHLVTLTGPGGIGKTRLGLQVAADLSEHFTDGTWFVSLAPLSDPDLVIPAISQALGLPEARDQLPLDQVQRALQEKKVLLLLDNFEQVVSAALSVADLLARCPRLKVLVTSREGLHLRAEREVTVPALALPDTRRLPDLVALSQYAAVSLFIERAQAVTPEFQMTKTNAPAVAEICVRLDGLPLAIELAAARIRLFSPQALLTRLGQRLPLLISNARDVPARQQTLRKTIQWSYDLLTTAEQRFFLRLSVFVGGCTLQAVEAVAEDVAEEQTSVLDTMTSLLDKNLLRQTEQEDGEPWFMMLETIREFGLEELSALGELEATRHAHAAFYLALSEQAEPERAGPQQVVWLERLELEHDNLRAAIQWLLEQEGTELRSEMALRLGGALMWFWQVRTHWSEGRTFLERALARNKGVAVQVQVKALQAAAYLAYLQGDIARAEALFEESLALSRKIGDTAGIALSLRRLGLIAEWRSNLKLAASRTEEALALFRAVGDKEGIAGSLSNLADIVGQQGEYARAISLYEESLAFFRAIGNKRDIAFSLFHLANVLFLSQGDPAKVRTLLEESLALRREVGHKTGIAWALALFGEVFLQQSDSVKARLLLEESLALCREIGHKHSTAESSPLLGRVEVNRQAGVVARFIVAKSLSLLGRVEAHEGNYAAARELYEEALSLAMEEDDTLNIHSYLEGLADVVAVQGNPAWAARFWGAAEALREAMGTPIPPVYRTDYDRSVASARSQLGEQTFATAWEEGRTMTLEQVFAARGPVLMPTSPPAPPSVVQSLPTYPNGLTAREVEVLHLLAQGLTDAHIADQLSISHRTVNSHLTSIYNKIQASSRDAATQYAIEHRLV